MKPHNLNYNFLPKLENSKWQHTTVLRKRSFKHISAMTSLNQRMLKNVEKATGMALENDGLIGGTNPIISPGLPWEN